ncbi:DNA helicase Pif1 like protein, partial [Pisolithus microcarpus]
EHNLNEKQQMAFEIITKNFVKNHIQRKGNDGDQLLMLMTGPGGTGKTHIVKAVHSVMNHYGCGHIIRYLAPTGSAAALIDGMTVHKGLGIKIKSMNKGKGNRLPGESQQDYTVLISVSNRSKLREEWKNVEYILLDEASLLSLELIADIDHALRFAKEKPDLWFGGMVIIFSGDFFQYPPVGGSPLYT